MKLEQIINQLTPANKKLAEVLIQQLAQQQGLQVSGNVTLPDPLDSLPLWVAWLKAAGKAPRTINLYKYVAQIYLKEDSHPTTLSVEAWAATRLETVSASRVSATIKALKSLFKYLVQHGLWDANPVANMVLVKGTQKEIECPSDEAILKLFNAKLRGEVNDRKFKVMLFLLINTGLRIDEANSLRRSLINLRLLEITVLGKGNKERIVPISEYVVGLLDSYMANNPTESPYLFPGNTKTGYWAQDSFRITLHHLCKKIGIKQIRPHQLRHYFATRTLEHGAKLEVISKILGHASVGITVSTYRHVQQREFHEEHEKHDPLTQLGAVPRLPVGRGEVIEGEVIEEK